MVFGDLLALFGLAISCTIFYFLAREGRPKKLTVAQHLLADRTVRSRDFGLTFAAASTSLATVLIFFIQMSSAFGLTLLFCGITYLLGQMFFLALVKKSNLDTSHLTTNADFWLAMTKDRSVAITISILTITSFVTILFVELYVGSSIVKYYIDLFSVSESGVPHQGAITSDQITTSTPLAAPLAFAAIGLLIILYVRLGGLNVVIRTDAWQLRLMLASMGALILFAIFTPAIVPAAAAGDATAAAATEATDWSQLFAFSASWNSVIVFWLFLAILNFTLPFTQVSSWQRVAASKDIGEAWMGFLKSIPAFLTLWLVPVIALVILQVKGYSISSLEGLFDAMRSSEDGFIEGILYPIMFVGFASALFSTGDTALIALQLSLADNTTFGENLATKDEVALRRVLIWGSVAVIAVLAGIFAIAEANVGNWFMPLVYAIFGQLAIAAPCLIYVLRRASVGKRGASLTQTGSRFCVVGLLLGWATIIVATVLKGLEQLPQQYTQEVATFIGIAFSLAGLLLGLRFRIPGSDDAPHDLGVIQVSDSDETPQSLGGK